MYQIFHFTDIHGCLDTFKNLFTLANPKSTDYIFFTGDYVDRGDKVYELITHLIELKKRFPRMYFIKGNHEDLFMRRLTNKLSMKEFNEHEFNGGIETIESYRKSLNFKGEMNFSHLPPDHMKFFKELKYMYILDKFVFVHGGLNPFKSLKDQTPNDVMRIRNDFLDLIQSKTMFDDIYTHDVDTLHKHNPWGKIVIHGHTPRYNGHPEFVKGYRINSDTACVFGERLTCTKILTGEYLSTKMVDKVFEDVWYKTYNKKIA